MWLHKRLGFVPVYYETPGDTSGGQGGAPAAVAQPPAGGQGAGEGGSTAQQGEFNWGLFPDVPEEQRPLLQPHLRGVLGHVTRMEEQYSPYRPMVQAGITQPEVVNGLLNFAQSFDQDPVSTWVQLGQNLQQQGVLSEDIDFDEVQAILDGTSDQLAPQAPTLPEGVNPDEPTGRMMAEIAELRQQLGGMQEQTQQERLQQQQAREERLLRGITDQMRTTLREAGFAEESITDGLLQAAIISHQGDHEAALAALTGFRNGSVRQAIQNHEHQRPGALRMPGGPPDPGVRPRGKDSWGRARAGAEQFLKTRIAEE